MFDYGPVCKGGFLERQSLQEKNNFSKLLHYVFNSTVEENKDVVILCFGTKKQF